MGCVNSKKRSSRLAVVEPNKYEDQNHTGSTAYTAGRSSDGGTSPIKTRYQDLYDLEPQDEGGWGPDPQPEQVAPEQVPAPGKETETETEKDEAAVPFVSKAPVPEPEPEAAPAESFCQAYFRKMRGSGVAGPPVPPWAYSGVSWVGAFVGIGTLGLIHTYLFPHITFAPLVMLVGSFGAMAVLLFGQPGAPVSQPWNAIAGNSIGAFAGVSVYEGAALLGLEGHIWLTGALAVSLAIVGQERLRAQHPPGGATALLFTLMPNLQVLHYTYVLCPAAVGAVIFALLSMMINNLSAVRSYPLCTYPLNLEPEPAAPAPDPEVALKEAVAPRGRVATYLGKFKGKGADPMPAPPWGHTTFSWLGSFLGIAALGLLQTYALPALPLTDVVLLVGSFGAMSVLLYSLPAAPLAQPKNALLGNTIGGLVGVAVVKASILCGLGDYFWLMSALAVSLTVVVQERTASVHPPGGATALIFVIRSCAAGLPPDHPFAITDVFDWYFFCPGFLGAAVLVAVAVLVNNISLKRAYPGRWW